MGIVLPREALSTLNAGKGDVLYSWGSSGKCRLGDYHFTALHPEAETTLMDLDLGHRITQAFNPSAKASNYHGQDSISEGSSVTSAIDISVRCLSDADIRQLLNTLADHDIAGLASNGRYQFRQPGDVQRTNIKARLVN